MLFILIGRDGPEGLHRRKAARPAHLAYLGNLSAAGDVIYAGPLLGGETDETPMGSTVIFEADSPEDARRIADADPYVLQGVFAATEIHITRQVLPQP